MTWLIILVFFILGVFLGWMASMRSLEKKHVGRLIIDLKNPLNDQPFYMELNQDVNMVYGMDFIILDVTHE